MAYEWRVWLMGCVVNGAYVSGCGLCKWVGLMTEFMHIFTYCIHVHVHFIIYNPLFLLSLPPSLPLSLSPSLPPLLPLSLSLTLSIIPPFLSFPPSLSPSLHPQVCVRTIAKCDTITPLMAAMRRRGDIIHIIAETIKKMFELCPAELVVQVSKPA